LLAFLTNLGGSIKFGFLLDDKEFECDGFSIRKLDDFEQSVSWFYDNVHVSDGWVYGSSRSLKKTQEEIKIFKSTAPIVDAKPFKLAATHYLVADTFSEDHKRFLILGYSFLQGLLLLPEGYQYLKRTPYRSGKLTGLILCRGDGVNGMNVINHFYLRSDEVMRKQMYTVLHWFLMGQSYEHEWEVFNSQYSVLDGLYKLHRLREGPLHPKKVSSMAPHGSRPKILAEKCGITLPEWADGGKAAALCVERNALAHEAIYAGNPIGYAVSAESYSLELVSLNTKLIAASLGIKCPYLKVNPENSNQHGWDIESLH